MKLRELIDHEVPAAVAEVEITGLSVDSRRVQPGDLFIAVPGTKTDGMRFADQAIAAGAAAVIAERVPATPPADAIFVQVLNARRALALAASKFYWRQPKNIAAVTGTSGKTSVAAFTRQIWASQRLKAASMGTVGLVSPTRTTYGSLTTPDPIELHKTLDALAGEGVTHLVLEASSHGLDQHRLDGVRLAAGAFTNLSRDHLDYHSTVEAYFTAKMRLFDELLPFSSGSAVVNADDEWSDEVIEVAHRRVLDRLMTVGMKGTGIKLNKVRAEGFAQVISVHHAGYDYVVRLPLVGAFQVSNVLVAAGLAIATGCAPREVFPSLARLAGAKGRLEHAGEFHGAPIFIDYAHKPDALAKALEALRPYVKRRLVVVFGAGGDRNSGKRGMMGAIAAEKADRVIITDDNPRSEKPAAIRAAILAEARGATEIGDRGKAIATAIRGLEEGDVLLIAGKGHETGQIVGDQTLPFSDHEAVARTLKGEGA